MQNKAQVFKSEEFGTIRVVEIDSLPWFVGKDVSGALGYKNTRDAVSKHVDVEDVTILQRSQNATFEIPSRGLTIVNESGLYSLILSSKLPEAKKFKRWVTAEVLPSIRKHGAYINDTLLAAAEESIDIAIGLFRELIAEKNKNDGLIVKLDALKPKAQYFDVVLKSTNAVSISLIAKEYGMTAACFNALLHDLHIQFKLGGTWLLYQQYANRGYTKTRTYFVNETTSTVHTYWTQKGRLFLYEKLKRYGMLPQIESGRAAIS